MSFWNRIAAAYRSVKAGDVNRIDGPGFKVYASGDKIRIDIEANAETEIHDYPGAPGGEGP